MKCHLLLLVPLLLAAAPAAEQDPPACDQDRVGTVACLAGKLCLCTYERGGTLSGRLEGFRWDCGVLRPSCPEPPVSLPPAPLPPLHLHLPLDPPPSWTPWPR